MRNILAHRVGEEHKDEIWELAEMKQSSRRVTSAMRAIYDDYCRPLTGLANAAGVIRRELRLGFTCTGGACTGIYRYTVNGVLVFTVYLYTGNPHFGPFSFFARTG